MSSDEYDPSDPTSDLDMADIPLPDEESDSDMYHPDSPTADLNIPLPDTSPVKLKTFTVKPPLPKGPPPDIPIATAPIPPFAPPPVVAPKPAEPVKRKSAAKLKSSSPTALKIGFQKIQFAVKTSVKVKPGLKPTIVRPTYIPETDYDLPNAAPGPFLIPSDDTALPDHTLVTEVPVEEQQPTSFTDKVPSDDDYEPDVANTSVLDKTQSSSRSVSPPIPATTEQDARDFLMKRQVRDSDKKKEAEAASMSEKTSLVPRSLASQKSKSKITERDKHADCISEENNEVQLSTTKPDGKLERTRKKSQRDSKRDDYHEIREHTKSKHEEKNMKDVKKRKTQQTPVTEKSRSKGKRVRHDDSPKLQKAPSSPHIPKEPRLFKSGKKKSTLEKRSPIKDVTSESSSSEYSSDEEVELTSEALSKAAEILKKKSGKKGSMKLAREAIREVLHRKIKMSLRAKMKTKRKHRENSTTTSDSISSSSSDSLSSDASSTESDESTPDVTSLRKRESDSEIVKKDTSDVVTKSRADKSAFIEKHSQTHRKISEGSDSHNEIESTGDASESFVQRDSSMHDGDHHVSSLDLQASIDKESVEAIIRDDSVDSNVNLDVSEQSNNIADDKFVFGKFSKPKATENAESQVSKSINLYDDIISAKDTTPSGHKAATRADRLASVFQTGVSHDSHHGDSEAVDHVENDVDLYSDLVDHNSQLISASETNRHNTGDEKKSNERDTQVTGHSSDVEQALERKSRSPPVSKTHSHRKRRRSSSRGRRRERTRSRSFDRQRRRRNSGAYRPRDAPRHSTYRKRVHSYRRGRNDHRRERDRSRSMDRRRSRERGYRRRSRSRSASRSRRLNRSRRSFSSDQSSPHRDLPSVRYTSPRKYTPSPAHPETPADKQLDTSGVLDMQVDNEPDAVQQPVTQLAPQVIPGVQSHFTSPGVAFSGMVPGLPLPPIPPPIPFGVGNQLPPPIPPPIPPPFPPPMMIGPPALPPGVHGTIPPPAFPGLPPPPPGSHMIGPVPVPRGFTTPAGITTYSQLPSSFDNDSVDLLAETCAKMNWNPPSFQLISQTEDNQFQFMVICDKVAYAPAVFCWSTEQAKSVAATGALQELGIVPYEPGAPAVYKTALAPSPNKLESSANKSDTSTAHDSSAHSVNDCSLDGASADIKIEDNKEKPSPKQENTSTSPRSGVIGAVGSPVKLKSRWLMREAGETVDDSKEKEPASPPCFEQIEDSVFLTEKPWKVSGTKRTRRFVCDCETTEEDRANGVIPCGEDCINRMMLVECGSRCPCGDFCQNRQFEKKMYAEVKPFQTDWKGWGLQAVKPIKRGTFIISYVGEVISFNDMLTRTIQYEKDGIIHHYFMALNDVVIDATKKGNLSRFINHSCEPNAETQKWQVSGDVRVGFFAIKDIAAGEEVTFDYQFEQYGKELQKCYCGAEMCRGVLGRRATRWVKSGGELPDATVKKPTVTGDVKLERDIAEMGQGMRQSGDVLRMCRIMVRAERGDHRHRLLASIRATEELACLKLFVAYHGLHILWTWMCETVENDLRMDILTTLKSFTFANKNPLIDSKVLSMVEKWAGIESRPSEASKLGASLSSTELGCSSGGSHAGTPRSQHGSSIGEGTPRSECSSPATTANPPCSSSASNESDSNALIVAEAQNLLSNWVELKEIYRIPKKLQHEQRKQAKIELDTGSAKKREAKSQSGPRPPQLLTRSDPKSRKEPQAQTTPTPDDLSREERRRLFEAHIAMTEQLEKETVNESPASTGVPSLPQPVIPPPNLPGQLIGYSPGPMAVPVPQRLQPTDPTVVQPAYVVPAPHALPPHLPPGLPVVMQSPVSQPPVMLPTVPSEPVPTVAPLPPPPTTTPPPLPQSTHPTDPRPHPPEDEHESADMSVDFEKDLEEVRRTIMNIEAERQQPSGSTNEAPVLDLAKFQQGVNEIKKLQKAILNLKSGGSSASSDAPPPPPPPSAPRRSLWKTAKDKHGQVYYYNVKTRESRWDPPTPTSSDVEGPVISAADTSSDAHKRTKEKFRSEVSRYIKSILKPYTRDECKVGRIKTSEDFKFLARKLTHLVLEKELKHTRSVEDLEFTDSVKHKTNNFVVNYMERQGKIYRKPPSPNVIYPGGSASDETYSSTSADLLDRI